MADAPVFTRKDYGFDSQNLNTIRQAVGKKSLSTWVPGPPATTPPALSAQADLANRFLTPQIFTPRDHKMHLNAQTRGESVPSLITILIVLFLRKNPKVEDESRFVTWVHNEPHLGIFLDLRVSYFDVDVRLKRKLRYEFAKC